MALSRRNYLSQKNVFTYGFKYVNRNNQPEEIKASSLQPTKAFDTKFHIAFGLVKEVNWPFKSADFIGQNEKSRKISIKK